MCWLNANKLNLNMTKTEFMLIGSGQGLNTIAASPSISMNGTRVKQVATTKSLNNNWWQTRLELPHWKTNQKNRFWNRYHETSGSSGYLTSYIPSFKDNLTLTTVVLFGEPVGLLYKTSCKNCRIEQPSFYPSPIMTLMLVNCWKSWGGKILIASETYKRLRWYLNAYMG